MPRQKARPKYMLHAATGQARTRIDGKDMYLGDYESQASRDRFQELLNCWLLRQNSTAVDISIDELALRFLAWADDYYRTPDLQPTGTATNM